MCQDCSNSTPLVFNVQSFINSNCTECEQQNCLPLKKLCYTGPNLNCSGINTGDTLEEALEKIDTQVCSAIGDYSTYQFNCLTAYWGNPITTEAEFVEAITEYVCTLNNSVTELTDTTFPNFQTNVDGRIADVESPSITCSIASVSPSDNLTTILTKYCTRFNTINTSLSLSGITWNSCMTVISTPTTIAQGFNLLASQICTVKAIADSAAVLPTFNNTGSCLSSPGSNDSLVNTINKIKTRLCLTPIFDISSVTWGCLDDSATNLQQGFQTLVDTVSDNQKILITEVSDDFNLVLVDSENDCLGKRLELATPIVNSDRLVASNIADTNPGTLIQKLTAGTGVTLDAVTTPGQVIISAPETYKVKASSTDDTPDTLDQKLNGDTQDGITINVDYNSSTKKVDISTTVDTNELADLILSAIGSNPILKAKFCGLVSSCSGECSTFIYTVTNSSGNEQMISWAVCDTSTPAYIYLADGDSVSICAIEGTVSEIVGVTVVQSGECISGTTTTTAAP